MLPATTLHRRRFGSLLAGGVALTLLPMRSAMAAPTAEEVARAINLAGRQRMLSQRAARAACFMRLEIEPSRHGEMLGKAAGLFDTTLAGLRRGSAEHGLATEEHPRVLEAIASVEALWERFKPLADVAAESGDVDDAAFEGIEKLNTPLLFTSDNVVEQLVLVHGKRTGSQGLASAINIAGRQRMLSQKMAKEAALIALEREAAANRRNLRDSVLLFDQSLEVLIDGLEALAIPPAPDHIRLKLLEVRNIWGPFGESMRGIVDGGEAGIAELYSVATQADPLLATMNHAVDLFEELSV